MKIRLINFHRHTQAIKRSVKLGIETFGIVCGQIRSDGFIRLRIQSRRIILQFHSKKDLRFNEV